MDEATMFEGHSIEPTFCAARGTVGCAPCHAIERLDPDHRDAVEAFLLALDQDSRKSRFGTPACDAGVLAHATHALNSATLLLAVSTGRRLCGLLEAYACDCGRLEIALAVERCMRCQGIGWRLMQASIKQGRLIGAARLQLIFAGDNWAMRRIAQKANARLDIVFGRICADIDLGAVSGSNYGSANIDCNITREAVGNE
jgi:hypothetical protein